jgi:hypothetical protein
MSELLIRELNFQEEMNFAALGDVKGGLVNTTSGITIEGSPERVKIKGPLSSSTSVQEKSSGTTSSGEVVEQPASSKVLDLFGLMPPLQFP